MWRCSSSPFKALPQNSVQTASQGGAGQGARSIDPAKEADIRSLMELVGARDAMQDFRRSWR